jgi:hypothetical protein
MDTFSCTGFKRSWRCQCNYRWGAGWRWPPTSCALADGSRRRAYVSVQCNLTIVDCRLNCWTLISNYPDEPYSGMRVFYESDVQNGDNNYPYAGPNSVEAVSWAAHPLYETAPFYVHDIGVVILQEPGIVLDEYGVLPQADQLDILKTKRGKQDTTFTAVGYGLQESFPDPAYWKTNNVKSAWLPTPN